MNPWSDFWVFVVWIATIATQGAEVGHDEVGSGMPWTAVGAGLGMGTRADGTRL
jgi:hypothetical protein